MITFRDGAALFGGIAIDGRFVSLSQLEEAAVEGIVSIRGLLGAGKELVATACSAAARALARGEGTSLDSVELAPPLPDPDKIIGLGLNYLPHAREVAQDPPSVPILFAKFRNALIGPRAEIVVPAACKKVDYEGELAVIIGVRCRDVTRQDALAVVGGYTVLNDVTDRDLQRQTSQWLAGKTPDTFAPMGPGIVPAAEIADPQDLRVVTRLNGEVVQEASTNQMVFPVAAAISHISSVVTLEPGDIIGTGTPGGVGSAQSPPRFLRGGDVVEVEIPEIGVIRNPVCSDSDRVPGRQTDAVAK